MRLTHKEKVIMYHILNIVYRNMIQSTESKYYTTDESLIITLGNDSFKHLKNIISKWEKE